MRGGVGAEEREPQPEDVDRRLDVAGELLPEELPAKPLESEPEPLVPKHLESVRLFVPTRAFVVVQPLKRPQPLHPQVRRRTVLFTRGRRKVAHALAVLCLRHKQPALQLLD